MQVIQNMMVINGLQDFWFKQTSGSGIANQPNYLLVNDPHQSVIRKF